MGGACEVLVEDVAVCWAVVGKRLANWVMPSIESSRRCRMVSMKRWFRKSAAVRCALVSFARVRKFNS